MTTQPTPQTGQAQQLTIDIVSKDAAGNITEHLRIHPDGKEEKLI